MIPEVPRELLDRHNKPGPRYTSYPTVPVWTEDFGDKEYRLALTSLSRRTDEALSVYLHLPFCVKKCDYCGCNSAAASGRGDPDDYLDRVEKEVAIVSDLVGEKRRVVQMHWGGGTPNFLTVAQLRRAMRLMKTAFRIETDAEISIETDPRIGTPDQARLLRDLGFNRISLGVQDFNPVVQKAIGRKQNEERTQSFFNACKAAGFTSVNLDMVYGLPAQTRDAFEKTLDTVIALGPDRVACFSYAHVPWVRENQRAIDASKLPAPHEKFGYFCRALERFSAAGYDWIGLDHFARRDDDLAVACRHRRLHRNFMGYTTRPDLPMLAFGMSGISDLGNCFAQNDPDLPGYLTALDQGNLPTVRGHILSDDDRIRRRAILHLMCNLELPFELRGVEKGLRLDAIFKPELDRLRAFESEGLLVFDADRLRVTDLGRFFIRNLCMELDAYLERAVDKPLFSKTI